MEATRLADKIDNPKENLPGTDTFAAIKTVGGGLTGLGSSFAKNGRELKNEFSFKNIGNYSAVNRLNSYLSTTM